MQSDDSRTQCHCERFDEYTEAFTVFFFELIGFAFQVTYVKIIMNTYLYTRILNTYLKMETAKK